ncbi:protease [Cupriavidus sp. CuC1]|uniref:protease n=1 Tax=Cupriavidus sp. CuC1 TaxID=3373131 RepID=UPI0037CF3B03
MSTETLMTETTATTTTEGQPASETTGTPATAAEQPGQQQQATEGQTTETAKPAGEGGESTSEQAKPQGAPEKYEFKAAEGQPQFDTQVIEQFSEVARELNLPQDAAQKVLDKMAPVLAARQADALEAARTQWAETAKVDKEFGGDKLNENLAVAKKALDQFGTPELRTLLNESGLGNHPEVLRVFYRAGKAISEDRFVPGGAGGKGQQGQRDLASALYPSQQS